VVPEIKLEIGRKKNDYYLEFDATDVGQGDQNYRLRFGRRGLVGVEYEYDQIPHFYSNHTAATPYTGSNGNLTLASKPVSTAGTDVRDWVNGAAASTDLQQNQRLSKFRINYTPTRGWRFTGGFNYQKSEGKRALGALFGSSPGQFNITELAEPIDYETYNIDVGGEYAGKVWGRQWTAGLKYSGSLFYNNTDTLRWDNPINLTGTGATCGDTGAYETDGTGGPCRGQLDLYPGNQAHSIALSGGGSLPAKTSFMGTFSYGWRLQNDSFLPFTVNTALAQPAISASSLGGDVRPLLLNLTLTNNYFKQLGLKAFYRFYDLENKSTSVSLPGGYIENDSAVSGITALQSFPYEYSKNNFGLSGSYKLLRSLRAKFEYLFENYHRSSSREVLTQITNSFGPTLDYTPTPWLLIQGSYRRGLRNAPGYDVGRQSAILVDETPDDLREERLDALRKYSQAARDDDRVRLFTQITPMDNLMFHAAFDFDQAYYSNTDIGRTSRVGYSPSLGFNYRPWERVTLFGNYNWSQTNWYMTAMERSAQNVDGCPGRNQQTPENCPSSVWNSTGANTVNTFGIGSDIVLIKDRLNFRIQYTYSYAENQIDASGNTTTGNTPAVDYPKVSSRWQEALARMEYILNKNISLKLAYYFNRFDSSDFGTDIMKPWMGDVDASGNVTRSIFLGDNINKPYEAHSGYFGVRYTYKTK
jgi:MtrB/PioB family decaheme-associated outer membrane protein